MSDRTAKPLEEVLRGHTPPHDLEAEREVLGAMLLSEKALHLGLELLRPEDFYAPAHQKVFQVIFDLYHGRNKTPVDYLMVKDELERRGELDEVGGLAYLQDLVTNVLSPALLEKHAQIVREKAVYRELIEKAWQTAQEALEEVEPAEELLEKVEQRFMEIRGRQIGEVFKTIRDLKEELTTLFTQELTTHEGTTGLPSGFPDLDRYTAGFHNGDLIIVASRPGMGKTSFVLSIMRYLSVEKEIPTAIFSLEMPAEQLAMRLLAMEARVSLHKLRRLEVRDVAGRLTDALERLVQAPIYIDDSSSLSVMDLRARARRAYDKGAKIIFVDYLQLLTAGDTRRREGNRVQEVSEISRSLKLLAKDLNLPVVALSQLSRAVEHREDKRPRLADLRESGAIEQDADLVLFLYRPEVYSPDPALEGKAEVIIAKNRNGPLASVDLTFLKEYTLFVPSTEAVGLPSDLPPLDHDTFDDFAF